MASHHDNVYWEGSDEEGQEDWTDIGWAEPIDASHRTLNHKPWQCNQVSSSNSKPIDGQSKDQEIQDLKTETLQALNSETNTGVNRMALNDNKAGMKGIDKERINQIIVEASKGSRFYENEKKKEEQMKKRILEQKVKVENLTEGQLHQGQMESDKLLDELKASRKLDRHIVHIDMDAFYAAVEMRDDPSLRDKPMAVGGSDMLSTSNYHARRYGVRAAMPGFIGRKLCPELVIVPTNFAKYTAVSKLVKEILVEYDPNYSMMSLDEAYLDFTHHVQQRQSLEIKCRTFLARSNDHCDKVLCVCDPNAATREWLVFHNGNHGNSVSHGDVVNLQSLSIKLSSDCEGPPSLTGEVCCQCGRKRPGVKVEVFGTSVEEAVREMRFRIEQKARLTASAGIAPNTLLAKVCSDYNKPNGQYRVQPTVEAVTKFVSSLPIRKVSGIGKVSEQMLNAIGIELCSHLYQKRALLYFLYSSISFNYFMRVTLGIGSTRIERDGERKSLSTERSFREINRPAELYQKCEELCSSLWEDIQQEQLMGKTITLKLKTVGFEVRTRAQTLPDYTNSREVLLDTAKDLLRVEIQCSSPQPLRLRLMGVRMSTLLHISQYSNQHQKTIKGMFSQLQSKHNSNSNSPDFIQPSLTAVTSAAEIVTSPCSGTSTNSPLKSPAKPSTSNSIDMAARISDTSSCTKDIASSTDIMPFGLSDVPESVLDMIEYDSDVPLSATTNHLASVEKTENDKIIVESANTDTNEAQICDTISQRTRQKRKSSSFSMFKNNVDSSQTSSIKSQSLSDLKKMAYTCPVCQKEVLTSSLNNMNKHVDRCLAKLTQVNEEPTNQDRDCVSTTFQQETETAAEDLFTCTSIKFAKSAVDCEALRLPSIEPTEVIPNGMQSTDMKFAKSAVVDYKNPRLPSIEPTELISSEMQSTNLSPVCNSKRQTTDNNHDNSKVQTSAVDPDSGTSHIPMSDSSTLCDASVHQCEDREDVNKSLHINMTENCDRTLKTDDHEVSESPVNSVSETAECLQSPSSRQRYCCPLCNIILTVSLGRFNDHVDRCLNQPAITSILKESTEQKQAIKTQKRLSVDHSPPIPAAKRKKNSNSPKSRSILSYLKR